jgi:Tfp pilus assembly protein PilF/ketosteroid isomerase-like protein
MYRNRILPTLILGSGLALLAGGARADLIVGNPLPTLTPDTVRADLAYLNKGQAALRARQFEQAEKAFGEAYRHNPRSVDAMLGLAMATHAQGKAKLARDWMSSAVAMAPGQPKVLQARARMLVEQGLPSAAEQSYRAAIGANPEQTQLKLDLAALYTDQLKKPAEALPLLRDLIRQNPELASAHLQLGLALSAEGKFDDAGRALDEAIKLAPNDALAVHARGLIALKQGQPDRALALFDKALVLRKDFAGAMLARGDALQALGKPDQAIETYKRAAALAPTSALPHALRAQAFERMKRPAEAEQAYREALKLEPDNPQLANNLAFLLASQKLKLDEALTLAQRAVAKESGRATYLDTLGTVQQARGDLATARYTFERAQGIEPTNAAVRQHLAALGSASAAAAQPKPVAVPVAAPAAVPVAPARSVSAEDPAKLVASRLEAWRQAWEAKDANRYLAFYARAFVPADKRSREAWEADRRIKLDKKGDIQVQISAPAYKLNGDVFLVNFEQRYQSGSYRDTGRKQLEWVREGGEWKIRREAQQ